MVEQWLSDAKEIGNVYHACASLYRKQLDSVKEEKISKFIETYENSFTQPSLPTLIEHWEKVKTKLIQLNSTAATTIILMI